MGLYVWLGAVPLSIPRTGGATMVYVSVPPLGSEPASVIGSEIGDWTVSPLWLLADGFPGSAATVTSDVRVTLFPPVSIALKV